MKPLEYNPNRKWLVEVTEQQLIDIINGMEDIHRFLCGDTRLFNTTCYAKGSNLHELRNRLDELHHYITPELDPDENYDWCGSGCEVESHKAAIQRTYAIYRNLRHCIEKRRPQRDYNVYRHETLTCGVPLASCHPLEEYFDKILEENKDILKRIKAK